MKKFYFGLLVGCLLCSNVCAEEFNWGNCTTYAPMPVLFIHGINANSLTWDIVTKELEKYFGYRWVRFNEPAPEGRITLDGKAVTVDRDHPDAPQNKVVKHYLEAFDYGGKNKAGSANPLNSHNDSSAPNSLPSKVEEILKAYYGDDWQKNKLIIVGHSQGGLIGRYYLQHGGADKVKRFINVNTPHCGSEWA
ncbi:MAG: alpha/beta fold hydrolase, partial [bacterium]